MTRKVVQQVSILTVYDLHLTSTCGVFSILSGAGGGGGVHCAGTWSCMARPLPSSLCWRGYLNSVVVAEDDTVLYPQTEE